MAENNNEIDDIIHTMRLNIKKQIIYSESDIQYNHFKLSGKIIPYKVLGYHSLKQLIDNNAADYFYFKQIGKNDFLIPMANSSTDLNSSINNNHSLSSETPYSSILKRVDRYAKRNDLHVSFVEEDQESRTNVNQLGTQHDKLRKKKILLEKQATLPYFEKKLKNNFAENLLMNPRVLPWTKKQWKLIITNPVTTVEVWARLVEHDQQASVIFI